MLDSDHWIVLSLQAIFFIFGMESRDIKDKGRT